MRGYLGVDVGSVSTNLVLLSEDEEVVESLYLRTQGRPIDAVQEGLRILRRSVPGFEVAGVGTTGSGRRLAGVLVGADVVKNEITAHAVAALKEVPDVRTVIEIGGQDSKIILLRSGVVVDFAMNTVCAAGTGSFLEHQAERLGVPVEKFGELAAASEAPVRIAGRCAVFAESDMVHKQQVGCLLPDIIRGLCEALVRNYLNNVGKGKEIHAPVVFQGGVAANAGMRQAFEEALRMPVTVPPRFDVMGAIGAAILAKRHVRSGRATGGTSFAGWVVPDHDFSARSRECTDCPNMCEIVEISRDSALIARWGGKCGKWEEARPVAPGPPDPSPMSGLSCPSGELESAAGR
ncbi:MAG: acyl-CoA dehydratase activase [Firmicutes bacterium]|jgi:predicted CoA-substrate-specific enzyme activase|nr:acyl-CoA dehydratase activase [Bacillota bacterium]